MSRLIVPILLILILVTISIAQSSTGHVNGEVWFRPFVRDINGFENRGLAKCEVTFQSGAAKKQIVSDEKGRYSSICLPASTTPGPIAPLWRELQWIINPRPEQT